MYRSHINHLNFIIMDKKFEKIYEIAQSEGWQVYYFYTDEKETMVSFLFQKYSPDGRDFVFEICVPNEEDEYTLYYNVADAIYTYFENFDVSYETYIWLDENGHGKNGASYDMSDVYKDTESCEKMIGDLWRSFYDKDLPKE